MFEYIQGKVAELCPTYVVIETGGVGYFINISLYTYSALASKPEVKLFVNQIVREDANLLYGFFSKTERELFRALISVSGIGSNTALMMLSAHSPDGITNAIVGEDVALLKSIKGIGTKTAQRVIIDLKDKLKAVEAGDAQIVGHSTPVRNEALSALVMLGFSKVNAEKALSKIMRKNADMGVEELVKTALKQL